jgi:hypothetical protein
MASQSSKTGPSGFENRKYNPLCGVDEEAISDMVNEELDIDSDDKTDLEIVGEIVSEKSSNEKSESESELAGLSGFNFSHYHHIQTSCGPIQIPMQWILELLPWGSEGLEHESDHHLHTSHNKKLFSLHRFPVKVKKKKVKISLLQAM